MSSKRGKVVLTVAQKQEICKYSENNPDCDLNDIRCHFNLKWSKSMSSSTIADVISTKSKWFVVKEKSNSLLFRPKKSCKELEEALFLWLTRVRMENASVTDEMLIEKAKYLGSKLGISNFDFSVGWLTRFKKRRGFSVKESHGENGDGDSVDGAEMGKRELLEYLKEYDLDNIFNMDETDLVYRMEPESSSEACSPRKGKKRSKDRITIGLCVNASGTEKRKPVVIGKEESLGEDFDPKPYVDYYYNGKAEMTGQIFMKWLKKFDKSMAKKNRKVVLIVDNASSHQVPLGLTNVVAIRPNSSVYLQPLDAGITRNFTLFYRQSLTRHFLACMDMSEPMTTINLQQALRFINEAWNSVSATTINNYWFHTGIIGKGQSRDTRLVAENAIKEMQTRLSESRELHSARRLTGCGEPSGHNNNWPQIKAARGDMLYKYRRKSPTKMTKLPFLSPQKTK